MHHIIPFFYNFFKFFALFIIKKIISAHILLLYMQILPFFLIKIIIIFQRFILMNFLFSSRINTAVQCLLNLQIFLLRAVLFLFCLLLPLLDYVCTNHSLLYVPKHLLGIRQISLTFKIIVFSLLLLVQRLIELEVRF